MSLAQSFRTLTIAARSSSKRPLMAIKLVQRLRFLRFLAVGLVNTAFGYAVFYLMLVAFGHSMPAVAVSTTVGALFNFFSIGAIVFGSSDRRLLWRFLAVYGVIFIVNAVGLRLLEAHGVRSALAQALLLPWLAALSYWLNRDFVFLDRRNAGRMA